MAKKTKAAIKFEQENNANRAFEKAQHEGARDYGLVWLYANMGATAAFGRGDPDNEAGRFADCEDKITRAIIAVSIQETMKEADKIITSHANTVNHMLDALIDLVSLYVPSTETGSKALERAQTLIAEFQPTN